VAITAWDWGAYLGERMRDGIRAKVSSFTRMHVNVNMVRGRSPASTSTASSPSEAVQAGYDEAILLDMTGFVAEASGENVFMVNKKDIVRTPPLSSPILAGITRRTVLRMLKDVGHPVEEVTFTRDALYISNEVFFTGTAAEITPVREVDNRRIGAGVPGPVVRKVQEAYFRVVRGQESRYAEWLTYVSARSERAWTGG
jgi:branched-chain amino acid aminotransferase